MMPDNYFDFLGLRHYLDMFFIGLIFATYKVIFVSRLAVALARKLLFSKQKQYTMVVNDDKLF
jgi:hypothetical protein